MTVLRYRSEAETKYPAFDPRLPVVAIDLDGTLAEDVWPSPGIGLLDLDALKMLQHYADAGCEVHIFTARPESHFPRIWKWLEKHHIDQYVYDVTRTKPVASVYVDDRAHNWKAIKNG